jgi:hypothetical protein
MNYNKVVEVEIKEGDIHHHPYHKHVGLKAFGIFTKIHFIVSGLVAAIALLIKLKYEYDAGGIALTLYLGLSELFLAFAVIPSLYYMVVDSDHHFNRIFYNDVHVIFSLLMVVYGVGSIITAVYLFKGFIYYLAPRYHLIMLIIGAVSIILEAILYNSIKRNRNLSVPAITAFHTFISQIMSFSVSALIIDIMFVTIYKQGWEWLFNTFNIVYVLDVFNGAYALTAILLLIFKHDIVFASVNVIYKVIMIIMFSRLNEILIPTCIYGGIVLITTIFTAVKYRRAFIGYYAE